jgi:hypothetical protein
VNPTASAVVFGSERFISTTRKTKHDQQLQYKLPWVCMGLVKICCGLNQHASWLEIRVQLPSNILLLIDGTSEEPRRCLCKDISWVHGNESVTKYMYKEFPFWLKITTDLRKLISIWTKLLASAKPLSTTLLYTIQVPRHAHPDPYLCDLSDPIMSDARDHERLGLHTNAAHRLELVSFPRQMLPSSHVQSSRESAQ